MASTNNRAEERVRIFGIVPLSLKVKLELTAAIDGGGRNDVLQSALKHYFDTHPHKSVIDAAAAKRLAAPERPRRQVRRKTDQR
jgi:hypothetical protein